MPAFIDADVFIKAVSDFPKTNIRSKGVKSEIPKTTIIRSSGETLIIQNPSNDIRLRLKGTWSKKAEVDAKILAHAMTAHYGAHTVVIAFTQKLYIMSEKSFSIIEPVNSLPKRTDTLI